jgi:pimeloyl-ACP methyl ester carboxylesterase
MRWCAGLTLMALLALRAPAGALPTAEARMVALGPIRVEFMVAGEDGPAVVFFGGLGVPAADWEPLLGRVGACARAVAWSRPGTGSSLPPPEGPVNASATAGLLYGALAVAGVEPPWVVVGHSLGGLYAEAFFRGFPDAAIGLVLVDAVMPNEPEGEFVSSVPPARGTPEFWEDAGTAAAKRAVAALPAPVLPVVVLTAGDHGDPPAREARWRQVQSRGAAAYPRGGQIVVEGSGHFIQHDAPEVVIAAIAQVLPDRYDCLMGE